jgi:hypothetical protein
MKPIPFLKLGRETCQQTKRPFGHYKQFGPKSFLNMQMRVESNEIN